MVTIGERMASIANVWLALLAIVTRLPASDLKPAMVAAAAGFFVSEILPTKVAHFCTESHTFYYCWSARSFTGPAVRFSRTS